MMVKTKNRILCLLALFGTLTLTGCDHLFSDIAGDYQGYIVKMHATQAALQTAVWGRVTSIKDKHYELETYDSVKNILQARFTVEVQSEKEIWVSSASINGSIAILKNSDPGCFRSRDRSNGRIALCYLNKGISIEIERSVRGERFDLTLDRLRRVTLPALEAPQFYTVEQVVTKTLEHSFESRVQFDRSVQSRLQAKTAQMNLIPHLSLSSIIAVAVDFPAGLLSTIGDLTPFLLPSRWLQAKSASEHSEAENDALILMRADSANVAEGMAYVLLRDLKIQDLLSEAFDMIQPIRDEIKFREKLSQFVPGTSDDLSALMHSMNEDFNTLNLSVTYETRAIAQSMGLVNPKGVLGIVGTTEFDVKHPQNVDAEWFNTEAYKRSIELRQIDSLIQASRHDRKERLYTWLDPAGDYRGGLGLNLSDYVATGDWQVLELLDKRTQLSAVHLQKVANTLSEIQNALESHRLAVEGKNLHMRRVDRYIQQMRLGTGFDLTGLSAALQDYVKAGTAETTAEFAYSIAASKVNRMLYSGYYRGIAVRPIR